MGKLNQELDDHRWIGFEIHDGVLPWIQGAQMQLSGIRVDPEDEIRYQTAVSSLREAVIECRELIQHLELVSKKSAVSISECIESLAERLAPLADQAGQTIVISGLSTLTPQFSMSTLWSIHRIVQQAIGNAIQHAGPATISISTQQVDDEFILEVSDNGRGFNLAELDRRRGIGLTSMHQ